jgi:hypothetical protein
LQGAVRLQGFASSPTPDTQVLDAWAYADVASTDKTHAAPSSVSHRVRDFIVSLPHVINTNATES